MTQSSTTCSIETHPDYPFVRIGRAFDFDTTLPQLDPRDCMVQPGDWWMEIAGTIHGETYASRTEAMTAVEPQIFAPWRMGQLIKEQIQHAIATQNIPLALRLAEGRGYAQGHREASKQFATTLAQADRILNPFKKLSLV